MKPSAALGNAVLISHGGSGRSSAPMDETLGMLVHLSAADGDGDTSTHLWDHCQDSMT